MSELLAEKQQEMVLSGSVKKGFSYLETEPDNVDFSVIKNIILHGHHQGNVLYIIRNFANKEICQDVAEKFNQMVDHNGGGNRADDGFVLTNQIGATQFSRNGEQYMAEVNRVNGSVAELMSVADSYATESLFLNRTLEDLFLDEGIHFGPARYKNSYACFATFRRWLDNGVMSLMPHEDRAQLKFAQQDDFEIADAMTVTAFNVCLEAAQGGGELKMWNLDPDEPCRARFGVTDTGYPYPPHLLQGVESLSVRLNAGDIYFMNACHLHGVSSVSQGSRLTAGRFIGRLNNSKVVYWT